MMLSHQFHTKLDSKAKKGQKSVPRKAAAASVSAGKARKQATVEDDGMVTDEESEGVRSSVSSIDPR